MKRTPGSYELHQHDKAYMIMVVFIIKTFIYLMVIFFLNMQIQPSHGARYLIPAQADLFLLFVVVIRHIFSWPVIA